MGAPPAEWIVFSSARSGDGDLYALQPKTGELRLVVGSPEAEGGGRFDAARDRLIYQRFGEPTILMSSGEKVLDDLAGDAAPVWSPDGERIAYSARRRGQENLYVARIDGRQEEQLTSGPASDRYPAWSPDGSELVFARRLETGWDLHAIALGGQAPEVRRLTRRGVYVGHPAWSPDGRSIAFDTSFDGEIEIARLDLATGRVERLTRRPGNDLVPAWSRDGKSLAFGGESEGDWELWLLELASGRLTRLTESEGFDGGPVFVPADVLRKR
ncbi:MAG: hypothetical protein AAF604_17330 [Acidobacteriota bacterium]